MVNFIVNCHCLSVCLSSTYRVCLYFHNSHCLHVSPHNCRCLFLHNCPSLPVYKQLSLSFFLKLTLSVYLSTMVTVCLSRTITVCLPLFNLNVCLSLQNYHSLSVSLQPNRLSVSPTLLLSVCLSSIFNCLSVSPALSLSVAGFWSRSLSEPEQPEPGYLAGAGAITLARLRFHLKYLFNNSLKLYGTLPHLMSFLK